MKKLDVLGIEWPHSFGIPMVERLEQCCVEIVRQFGGVRVRCVCQFRIDNKRLN
jgi:hypothetical protein